MDETHKSRDLVPATMAAGQALLLLRTQRLRGSNAGERVHMLERTQSASVSFQLSDLGQVHSVCLPAKWRQECLPWLLLKDEMRCHTCHA